ncbi:hypothetical protein HYU14_02825 [Candidatus Woesearchaeota archaeon]|nr:hypothetical protein [Candidatus Woesearchaeota archaeon]
MKNAIKLNVIVGVLMILLAGFSITGQAACTSGCGSFSGGQISLEKLSVEANDVDLSTSSSEPKQLTKTDELDVLIVFKLNKSVNDVQVRAELTGYDKSDKEKVTDETDNFDVAAGSVYDKRLKLELPIRLDQGNYALKVRIETREETFTQTFPLFIEGEEHLLEIRDIVLSPESEVKAGRALLASVRIKNRGERQEEDVKVKVSIPALGISASDFVDELDEEDCNDNRSDCDDSTTSEELFLRIPDCAEPGDYTVRADVEFDDGDEEVSRTTQITVAEGDLCSGGKSASSGASSAKPAAGRTVIAVSQEPNTVNAGGTTSYPVIITNEGSTSRSYSLSADASFADAAITPNVLVIGAGESKTATVTITAKPGILGSQQFTLTVKSGDEVLQQIPLKANVIAPASTFGRAKKLLEVGVIVVLALIIILALIIGFNKLRGNDEDKGEGQSYY